MHNDVCMQTWVVHLFVLGGIYLCWICVPRRALVSASSGRTPSGEGDALEQHFVHHFADDRNEDFIERLGTRAHCTSRAVALHTLFSAEVPRTSLSITSHAIPDPPRAVSG